LSLSGEAQKTLQVVANKRRRKLRRVIERNPEEGRKKINEILSIKIKSLIYSMY
jgi:hypothetical protein